MKQKKFNCIDIIAAILIVAVVAFVGYKLATRTTGITAGVAEMVDVTYVAKVEGVDAAFYDNVQQYIPSQLMASGELYNGYIVGVEQEPYLVLSANGEWVEDPGHINLYFTVEGTIAKQSVMTTDVANQEIRLGRKSNIIKTEYIEFGDCIIVDVTWN